MSDRRRSQWIALDSFFFGSDLHAELQERFGPAGVCVWVAYLCACKRNLVQGQISYHSDADALAQMGLHGLELVNQDGEEWTMDALWTYLGRVKNVSRRRRGRVTDVLCTRWERWQKTARMQQQAEQKSSSRPGNTETLRGQYVDVTATDRDSDSDNYTDRDSETRSPLLASGFDAFWNEYPRQAQSGEARKAWRAARGRGVSETDMLIGLRSWCSYWRAEGTEEQFIPYAAKFIRSEKYAETPPQARQSKAQKRTGQLIGVIESFVAEESA